MIGAASGHGIANQRLMADFAEWIEANRDKVAGYDPALTPLEQLDKLSDDQFVRIATGLEPNDKGC